MVLDISVEDRRYKFNMIIQMIMPPTTLCTILEKNQNTGTNRHHIYDYLLKLCSHSLPAFNVVPNIVVPN